MRRNGLSLSAIIISVVLLISGCGGGGGGGGSADNPGVTDTTAPTVSSTSPANGAAGVAINSSISVTFSEAMDSATVMGSTFILTGGSGSVSGAVTCNGTTATFTPSSDLSYNTTYTASITTGAKDAAGNALASNYTWSFTTGNASDATPPTVSSTSPASNATGVAVNSAITVTFSEVMDASSITASTFYIGGVSGTVSYSGTTATFTPSSNLSYNTTYTVTVTTGVKDAAGNAMANAYTWSFTTGSAPDTTPPTVSSTSPASNTTGVAINSAITATFSETMDSSTLTTSTFTLKQGTTPISGTVTYSGTTATFTPSSNLSYNTAYTATVTTGGKDAAGNAMASNYSWSFSTLMQTAAIYLPKSGQTSSYATGDDGESETGVSWPSPRFTVGVGTEADCVTDNLTGLMWLKSPDSTTRTWQQALDYANNLTLCGYSDWRLPNVNELESLVNAGQSNNATWLNGQGFNNVQGSYYWSSTTYANDTALAPYVSMFDGTMSNVYKANFYHYVWPVRASQGSAPANLPKTGQTTSYATGDDGDLEKGVVWPNPRFTVGTGAEADCVIDNLTGLMWVKSHDSTTRTWTDALTYANGLSLCGYTDWRLPNRKELRSLVNYGQSDNVTWLDAQGFSNVQANHYWSSTTYAVNTDFAWSVNMYAVYVYFGNKTNYYYVWPVRGGQ